MTAPRAFVSFDFDHDATAKMLFVGQATNDSPTPFTVADWSSKSALPQSTWEAQVRHKVNQCHMLIALVGRHMPTAIGVVKEIKMAQDLNVPYFGVYVNGANSNSALPVGLSSNSIVPWKWDRIANMVDQCMVMGKNRR